LVQLLGQLLDAMPRHEQCRGDDQQHSRPEQELALSRERDAKLLNATEQGLVGRLYRSCC
jgi:hypothetical protein